MKNTLITLAAILYANTSIAAGDPGAGEEKAKVCASCHGVDGISQASNFPILAGQYADYIVQALQDYKSGERDNAVMKGFAVNLSRQDMQDLGAWFSRQPGLTAPRIADH